MEKDKLIGQTIAGYRIGIFATEIIKRITLSALRSTVKRENMKYTVWCNNNVESNKVSEFETLEEAKAYCDNNTDGYDEVADGDNCYEGCGNNFRYEVYDGEPVEITYDEDGEVDDERTVPKDAVYQTKQYYCK